MGEVNQGPNPYTGTIVRIRGETFKAECETADLWQPKWNENQTVLPKAIHTLDRNPGPLEGAMAGSWSLGMWSSLRVRAAVDCGETDGEDLRKEIVVGNACEGKPSTHGSKATLLSHG